jgi:hypothetical protein
MPDGSDGSRVNPPVIVAPRPTTMMTMEASEVVIFAPAARRNPYLTAFRGGTW